MSDTPDRKKKIKQIVLIATSVLMLLVITAVAGAGLYVNHLLNKINKVDPDLEYTLSPSEADDLVNEDPDLVPVDPEGGEEYEKIEDILLPTWSTAPVLPSQPDDPTDPTESTAPSVPTISDVHGDHLINVLLVGQDRREGQGRQRSDTMILVSINKSNSTITLTSFMRDMYVQIPGYKPNRVNAAYAFGGMSLLTETMELNFGVLLDGIVEVDFNGFKNIITLLGGVEVELTAPEAKYLNDLYEVKLLDSPVVVGKNLLDADQAMVYVQLREIDSDYHRTTRQRKLILSIIEAYKNQPLDQMLGLLDEILPMVATDMSNMEILECAVECFPMLASVQIKTQRLPVDGTYSQGLVLIREGFCAWLMYNIDFDANREVLWEVFRPKD